MELTREKVLAMEAGESLDRLIAQKVMNWHITQGEYSGKEYWNDEDDYSPYSVKDFKPSTDISAAWEVVDKITGPLWMMHSLSQRLDPDSNLDGYEFCFLDRRIGKCRTATADTVPLAICRAALLTTLTE